MWQSNLLAGYYLAKTPNIMEKSTFARIACNDFGKRALETSI